MQCLPLPSCSRGTCSGLLCSLQSVSSCRNICCDSRTRDVSGGTGDKWHSSHANALPDNAAGDLRTIYLVAGWNKSKKAASLHNVQYCVNKNYPDGSLFCHTTQGLFKRNWLISWLLCWTSNCIWVQRAAFPGQMIFKVVIVCWKNRKKNKNSKKPKNLFNFLALLPPSILQLYLQVPCSAMLTHPGDHPHSKVGEGSLSCSRRMWLLQNERWCLLQTPEWIQFKLKALTPVFTLQAEELLNIMGFIHIDRELYAHTDFKYRWPPSMEWLPSHLLAGPGWKHYHPREMTSSPRALSDMSLQSPGKGDAGAQSRA